MPEIFKRRIGIVRRRRAAVRYEARPVVHVEKVTFVKRVFIVYDFADSRQYTRNAAEERSPLAHVPFIKVTARNLLRFIQDFKPVAGIITKYVIYIRDMFLKGYNGKIPVQFIFRNVVRVIEILCRSVRTVKHHNRPIYPCNLSAFRVGCKRHSDFLSVAVIVDLHKRHESIFQNDSVRRYVIKRNVYTFYRRTQYIHTLTAEYFSNLIGGYIIKIVYLADRNLYSFGINCERRLFVFFQILNLHKPLIRKFDF